MPYISAKPPGSFLSKQVAEIVGIPQSSFSQFVKRGWIPKPDRVGDRRVYYSPSQLEKVKAAVAKLRAEGKIK